MDLNLRDVFRGTGTLNFELCYPSLLGAYEIAEERRGSVQATSREASPANKTINKFSRFNNQTTPYLEFHPSFGLRGVCSTSHSSLLSRIKTANSTLTTPHQIPISIRPRNTWNRIPPVIQHIEIANCWEKWCFTTYSQTQRCLTYIFMYMCGAFSLE
jgi:hypothetical protein